jgi:UDP-N-acetylmuramoyl-L-alanyl-D-glutamate--2,6-diaminopimelate ligase
MTLRLASLVLNDGMCEAGANDTVVAGLTADSRAVKTGDVFAALAGTKANGAQFIRDAISKGAAAIICDGTTVVPNGVPVVRCENPRRLLALAAARFYGAQPDTIVAVTGTNGKTSVSVFVRQIWQELGFRAASLGTIGIVGPQGTQYLAHTTPDPVQLHASLAALKDDGVEHLAVEASSHGLVQNRLDGLRLSAGAFTNLTRDHLDYHQTFEAYFDAKMMLFEKLLREGAAAVINADIAEADAIVQRARQHGLQTFTVGQNGENLRLLAVERSDVGQILKLQMSDGTFDVPLPLVGDFQASNALVAAGLVLSTGGEPALVRHALASLKGATGRLELVGQKPNGARVYVDYAHTPDAIETALHALRPFTAGKLHIVFGCGGDRDKGKRPLMAKAAVRHADSVYVTDDNPRNEDPRAIRREVLEGAPTAVEIADRAEAIATAVAALNAGDNLLVAGKGHEVGQIIGAKVLEFSDHAAVAAALSGKTYGVGSSLVS